MSPLSYSRYTFSPALSDCLAKFDASIEYGCGSTPGLTDSGVSTSNNLKLTVSPESFNFTFTVSPSITLSTEASADPFGTELSFVS